MKTYLIGAGILAVVAVGALVFWYIGDDKELPVPAETEEKASPDVMGATDTSLVGTSWTWLYTELEGGDRITAPSGDRFVLGFESDGRMSSITDCNTVSGSYVVDGDQISFAQMSMTKMFCQNSMESDYIDQLSSVASYVIEGSLLEMSLKEDGGVMVFIKVQGK
jgi:heat shock protein HslJ